MFRRLFLRTLSAAATLQIAPNRADSDYPPEMPSERNLLFWYHVYSAIQRDRPMSTEQARKQTVSDLTLEDVSEEKAAQVLRLANDGVYEIGDLPGCWGSVFDEWEYEVSR